MSEILWSISLIILGKSQQSLWNKSIIKKNSLLSGYQIFGYNEPIWQVNKIYQVILMLSVDEGTTIFCKYYRKKEEF